MPKDANETTATSKSKCAIQLVHWSLSGFKGGIKYQPPISVQVMRAVRMNSNATAFAEGVGMVAWKGQSLFSKLTGAAAAQILRRFAWHCLRNLCGLKLLRWVASSPGWPVATAHRSLHHSETDEGCHTGVPHRPVCGFPFGRRFHFTPTRGLTSSSCSMN